MNRIGIITSGGDAPGMNACIRAIVRTACPQGIEVFGIRQGLQGLIDNNMSKLKTSDVANIVQRGGTILQSSRSEDFRTKEGRQKAYANISSNALDGLICIGGEGTFTAADVIGKETGLPVICCPCTIDNDLYGSDNTIGFDTAVNTVTEAIDKIRDTAESHNNVFFVEVMGRHSGYIALYTAISCGAEAVLLPEITGDYESFIEKFKNSSKRKKQFSIVIVAEGDEEGNAIEIASKFKKEFPEHSPKVTVLGHIQRGGAPSANDRILASRLGNAAVDAIVEGRKGVAVGLVNHKIIYTPLLEAVDTRKWLNFDFLKLAEILSA